MKSCWCGSSNIALLPPNLPGYGELHRLVTTLLDLELAPLIDLIFTYHERWEIEITLDEIDSQQRLLPDPCGVSNRLGHPGVI